MIASRILRPFEFIILFFSFIYTLALTHLLFAWTSDDPASAAATILLATSALDAGRAGQPLRELDQPLGFRTEGGLTLATIVGGFLFVIVNYFMCALVSPDFEGGETYDMKRFHEFEGPTYITAVLVLIASSIVVNFLAGAALNVTHWSSENVLVGAMLIPVAVPLVWKRGWIQIVAPVALLVLNIAYAVIYYPVLN